MRYIVTYTQECQGCNTIEAEDEEDARRKFHKRTQEPDFKPEEEWRKEYIVTAIIKT